MASLDTQIVIEAKKKFLNSYGERIKDIGYTLAAGVTSLESSLGIIAMIQDYNEIGIGSDVKGQIENIIPKAYHYKEHEIPVVIRYSGKLVKF